MGSGNNTSTCTLFSNIFMMYTILIWSTSLILGGYIGYVVVVAVMHTFCDCMI